MHNNMHLKCKYVLIIFAPNLLVYPKNGNSATTTIKINIQSQRVHNMIHFCPPQSCFITAKQFHFLQSKYIFHHWSEEKLWRESKHSWGLWKLNSTNLMTRNTNNIMTKHKEAQNCLLFHLWSYHLQTLWSLVHLEGNKQDWVNHCKLKTSMQFDVLYLIDCL